MGIEPICREADLTARLNRAQDEIFDGIVACRACLPIDLLRMPTVDLLELARGERSLPAIGALLASLQRFINERSMGE